MTPLSCFRICDNIIGATKSTILESNSLSIGNNIHFICQAFWKDVLNFRFHILPQVVIQIVHWCRCQRG